ncbi:hypothetical protein CERSUDRAFT_108825 [Gelatoporia subvermispora B]|uniref:Uncharacterized protein n=1 Tax=Ceriporiopsis subvermispora (strain B) TaxID=914234 RepID=M2R2C7_CERS8|nr:hypothetical protein CERSUDRAFT_108825 [Gelatoporia subvermispora B]
MHCIRRKALKHCHQAHLSDYANSRTVQTLKPSRFICSAVPAPDALTSPSYSSSSSLSVFEDEYAHLRSGVSKSHARPPALQGLQGHPPVYLPELVFSSDGNKHEPALYSSRDPELHNADGPEPGNSGEGEISDQEWEIRTGRAIYTLQQTLPDFFSTGLISSLETPLVAGRANGKDGAEEGIYSRNIRLSYTPPNPLPSPFPRTLHIEGHPLYMASSVFVRHTLNALYTDLRVTLRRVRVHGPRSSNGPSSQSGSASLPGLPDQPPGPEGASRPHRSIREKSLFIGLDVSGVARVTGERGGWEVNSTYVFSPLTGLIHAHIVDSIEPAPHQAVFGALRAALAKLKLGLAVGPGREGTGASGVARTEGCARRL